MVERLSRLAQRPLRLRNGSRTARYAAPVAFLLAVTVAVLVVRSALRSDSTPSRSESSSVTTAGRGAARGTKAPALPKRFYVVRSGDTLGGIAARFATTVDALLRLNPGIEPTALIPGQQVRVK